MIQSSKPVCVEVYGCVVVWAERPIVDGAPWIVTVRCAQEESVVLAAVPASDEFAAGRTFQRMVDAVWPTTVEELREFAAGKKTLGRTPSAESR